MTAFSPAKEPVRKPFNWEDIVTAAGRLQIEPCVLQAVCTVESSANGFLLSGRPTILFEGHIFWQQLKRRRYQPDKDWANFARRYNGPGKRADGIINSPHLKPHLFS